MGLAPLQNNPPSPILLREDRVIYSSPSTSNQTWNLLAPWSWTSQPPELWEIIFVVFITHSVYSVLL